MHTDVANVGQTSVESVAIELDAMHAKAAEIIARRDFAAYRNLFLPELSYQRADGRVVGRDELVRDAVRQTHGFRSRHSTIVRETLDLDGDGNDNGDRVTEVVTRTVRVGVSAFLVVHRTFEYVIKGRYTWRKVDGGWRIERIEVIEHRVAPGRFIFGLRARPGDGTID